MKSKVTRKVNAATQLLITIGMLLVANFLASRHFLRADFTADKEYTLAPSSRRLAAGLTDIVNVNVYFSRNIPPYLTELKTRVQDLLSEYRAWGGGNLQVNFIAPDEDPATEQRLRMMGIPKVQLNVLDKDQFQVTQVYMGLAVLYGNKKETIPVIQDTQDLEYQLTSAILRVTRKAPVKVAVARGGEDLAAGRFQGQAYGLLEQEVRRQYDVADFRLGADAAIPPEVSTLVVAGPVEPAERDLFRLDQFVARGGKLILLLDVIDMEEGGLRAREADHKFDRLLKAWGIEVGPGVVADPRNNAPASFSSGFMRIRIPYPFWPDVPPEGFEKDSPITGRLESLVMPWTSPVARAEDAPSGVKYTVLARSSAASWIQEEPYDFTPGEMNMAGRQGGKEEPLALLASGAFRSAFAEGGLPEGLGEDEKREMRRESAPTSILVVGGARFLQDDFLAQFPANGLFFMNALDWMAQGEELIGIRSRGSSGRPLPELSEEVRSAVRYVNVFALPGLVLLVGLARLYWRRKVAVGNF